MRKGLAHAARGAGIAVCVLAGTLLGNVATAQPARAHYSPRGITEPKTFYYPNAFADPATGMKSSWVVPGSTKTPKYGWWQNQEHAILKPAPNRWLVVLMENNRAYNQPPNVEFVDAYKFLEYDDRIVDGATTPTAQSAYWRGNTLSSHSYVWAPALVYDAGTYYLFFTAKDPINSNWLACHLATSTTGNTNAAGWVEYDPTPATPAIDPLFRGTDASVKDFHVIRVETPQGPRYYCYYIANLSVPDPQNPAQMVGIAEVRLRISDSLVNWQATQERTVFRKINVGLTAPIRYVVDYENPEVIQYDDGSFYLLISRHGQIPADYQTNSAWTPIPLSTEVYWSPDGLEFTPENQLPNLTSPSGQEINAAEYVQDGTRWFATDAQPSFNPNYYELDEPWSNPVRHSDILLRLLSAFTEPENCVKILEIEWAQITNAAPWEFYQ